MIDPQRYAIDLWRSLLQRLLGRFYGDHQPLPIAVGLGFGLLTLSGEGLAPLWLTLIMIVIAVAPTVWQERRWSDERI